MKFWFTNHHISIAWVLFVLKNHLEKVLLGAAQTMRCTICHVTRQVQSSNNIAHEHKGHLTYNPTHGITFIKKHIDNEHEAIVAKYVLHHKNEDETSSPGRKKCKNYKRATPFVITEFFSNVQSYKSSNPLQLVFIEDLVLFITKGYVPLSTMESS